MHWQTARCKKGAERKWRRLAEEEEKEVTSREFSAYGIPLEMVTSFRYLGRVILASNEDWMLVVWNLAKERAVCSRMTSILRKEEADPRVSIFFLKSVARSVLVFVAETWVVTPCMGWALGGCYRTSWRGN